MKIDRLIGILTILLQNEKTTAPILSARFEVSRRTILRDIDALCQAGIPIVTTQGGDGGISIMKGYKISKNVLTTEELQNLIAGLKGMDSIAKKSNFENLMLKLAPENNAIVSFTDNIIIDLSSHYKDSLSEKITLLKQAIAESKTVTFDYYSSKGESKRVIEPYFIEFKWSAWYVFGWCFLRNDFRRFKLHRLWDLKITEHCFIQRPISDESIDANNAFSNQYHIKIWFDKSVHFRLIEEYGLHSYVETENGLLFTTDYTNKDYMFSWLLGFGDKAKLLEPECIRTEFASLLKNMSDLY